MMNSTLNNTDATVIENGDKSSKTVIIYAGASISLVVLATCVLLCYREVSRRRMESHLIDEMARRELIKRTVKHKLEQMARSEDSKSYMEHMELKVPYVTFGEVTKISPTPSFVELHHRNLSHQNLQDYPYQHLQEHQDSVSCKPVIGQTLTHSDQHHMGSRSATSLFTYLKTRLFSRPRTRSDSSGSGSGSEEDSVEMEIKVVEFTP